MRMFSLLFASHGDDEPRRIHFEAHDPSAAFELAEREGDDRAMQLFEGDTHLGTLEDMGGFWRLSPA